MDRWSFGVWGTPDRSLKCFNLQFKCSKFKLFAHCQEAENVAKDTCIYNIF